jgi:hypothetical protein
MKTEVNLDKLGCCFSTCCNQPEDQDGCLLVVAPCILVEVYQSFRGPCCHQNQGDESSTRLHGATTQKTAIFILTAVRTSNPT